MSGLCGWVGRRDSSGSSDEVIRAMSAVLSRFDHAPIHIDGKNGHRIAVAASSGRAFISAAHGYTAAVWGSPDFVDDELAKVAHVSGPASAAIEAMRRHGPTFCKTMHGTFAVAVVNEASGEALLAIDRMGVHSLIFTELGHTLVFGSTADAIHRFPGIKRDIDWQSIYNYVHFHVVPGPATVFRGERRLLPGQYLHWRAGQMTLAQYWKIQFVEDEDRPFGELRDEFLATLTDAVRRMSSQASTGAFLSGGTDSSTLSGLLGQVTGKPAKTFSIGFAEQGYDEMDFARIAARHFKTEQHEYYVTPADIVDAIPQLAAIHDQPFGNSSAVPTYCCAKFAKENGIELLLGGDGGDELFGGNERYATQYRYSHYGKIPGALRSGVLEPLARVMPGGGLLPPIRWYRRLIELASAPMPDRMDAHNLLLRLGASNVFTADMLERIDPHGPQQLMRNVYQAANGESLINKMLAYDFQFTLADSDLPKVMKSCELAGVPVEFPMLDDSLVEFSARLMPRMKLKGTKLRYFFKEALRGFLPDEIISKSKHGFGLPFGRWLKTHEPLESLVMDNLSALRDRRFIQPEFIDRLMTDHLAQHAGYYGEMAWILVMLEQWFTKQESYSTSETNALKPVGVEPSKSSLLAAT